VRLQRRSLGTGKSLSFVRHNLPTIWRFIDFTKFVDLLDKQALFFCRADKFADPYEGSYPAKFFLREKQVAERYTEIQDYPPIHCVPEQRRRLREYVAINCWHMNEHESAAMWSLYLKSEDGVAIRTSRKGLNKALSGACATLISDNLKLLWATPVRYVDFEDDDPNLGEIGAFTLKRKSFEHERELRAIIWRNVERRIEGLEPIPSNGLLVPIDLDTLVECVYVSPTAKPWFADLVRSVIGTYGFNWKVIHSSMYDDSALY